MRFLVPILALMTLATSALADGEYRHIVCFKFKPGTPPAEIERIEKEFAALPEKIDTITAFEWGTNVSPENLDKGFTHAFLVTFKDKAGLETYLPHPAHKAFVEGLKPHMEDAFVFDYVAR
ncbi:Dabb family protein [Haloferula sp. A504]|uniref:Dabb family protein n=1 Tax=Haloferula sp. A504 TaxID=3373601 RepID=UPI0031C1517E|nr:Dabb family protein [Verrucomicrobiaceae bacterium E54]